ncbi:MAG TPA: carbonate dehydratase [Elusimicrobiota bacterium]|jgi:carbonic anhydrase|nr:carbonate dehydratase [Elusimicrobiota bacterium]HNA59522.1 carbonate dehydratase [Elusimicrobiota bacterium]HNC74414.1 carbonate dehydratase [Elusimicrobiota bacterium]HNF59926.1 carbonate dehydratase [Elusimicrobiota bacterium]HNI56491.1 carbonate dehydratase [Elusimicrobiota bacterium]
MNPVDRLLQNNRRWAQKVQRQDPTFFKKLSRQQRPHYLWIGCSDSRVPANQITGLLPGDVFVHRNVANLVVHTDLNCLSVIQFAVDVLKVKHIIVCGHYGCGGVGAALRKDSLGLADNWIRHVQDVAHLHRDELSRLPTQNARLNRLAELNVTAQLINLCGTTVVQSAWKRRQPLSVHGWIYGIADGIIKDLGLSARGPGDLPAPGDRRLFPG